MVRLPSEKTHSIENFETSGKAGIYKIPLEVFPGFWSNVYLVLLDDYRVLIDTGSNFSSSNEGLEAGLKGASQQIGETIGLSDLTHVLITHGHIDHFGGLAYVRPRTEALIGIHELDRRVLTNFEERLVVVARRLEEFLLESGISQERVEKLLEMYMLPKELFRSTEVDFTYQAVGMQLGPFKMLHVSGHCAGMVVIRLHDVLFSGDHILTHISPHQAPESLTLHTGLGHYLDSLAATRAWASDVRLTLGGHRMPIHNLAKRIDEIRAEHVTRLERVMEVLGKPHTVAEVSHDLFGEVSGYNVLLALEEAGAHVEYLYQRGLLGIDNLNEVESNHRPVPIRYRSLVDSVDTEKLVPR